MMGCLYSGCFRGILVVTSSLVFGNMTEQLQYGWLSIIFCSFLSHVWDYQRSGEVFMSKIEQSINSVERKQPTLLILNSQNDFRNPDLDLNHEEARKNSKKPRNSIQFQRSISFDKNDHQ